MGRGHISGNIGFEQALHSAPEARHQLLFPPLKTLHNFTRPPANLSNQAPLLQAVQNGTSLVRLRNCQAIASLSSGVHVSVMNMPPCRVVPGGVATVASAAAAPPVVVLVTACSGCCSADAPATPPAAAAAPTVAAGCCSAACSVASPAPAACCVVVVVVCGSSVVSGASIGPPRRPMAPGTEGQLTHDKHRARCAKQVEQGNAGCIQRWWAFESNPTVDRQIS